jgi:hypothetical protein
MHFFDFFLLKFWKEFFTNLGERRRRGGRSGKLVEGMSFVKSTSFGYP